MNAALGIRTMECSEEYRRYLSTLKERLQSEGFSQRDFEDISENELIFDFNRVELLNREMRSFKTIWLIDQQQPRYWPDDYFIIGGGGNGDYYCISKTGKFSGVMCFEHECLIFSEYASSLEDFYLKTIEIMRPRLDKNA